MVAAREPGKQAGTVPASVPSEHIVMVTLVDALQIEWLNDPVADDIVRTIEAFSSGIRHGRTSISTQFRCDVYHTLCVFQINDNGGVTL
ncbi:MAG: hypothetical protein CSB46_05800 [Micrococcales bacterium]|nr:MAG: hypothetical protein CSB46_05800 [Micrococcales bacterium]